MPSPAAPSPEDSSPRPPRRWNVRQARRQQHAFWDPTYEATADPMGDEPSAMLRWALLFLPAHPEGERLIELGCGTGRDLAEFIRRGFEVAAVDLSRPAVRTARMPTLEIERPQGRARPIIDVGDAVEFLQTQPPQSAAAVYSNLFLTMGLPPSAERTLAREIARVLRPGGLHLFSVRSQDDPWFGRGRPLGPGIFDLSPHGPPVRFFTESELRRRARGRYEVLEIRRGVEGEGEYARDVLYVVERRRSPSSTARE